jgi:hypothetical protein
MGCCAVYNLVGALTPVLRPLMGALLISELRFCLAWWVRSVFFFGLGFGLRVRHLTATVEVLALFWIGRRPRLAACFARLLPVRQPVSHSLFWRVRLSAAYGLIRDWRAMSFVI